MGDGSISYRDAVAAAVKEEKGSAKACDYLERYDLAASVFFGVKLYDFACDCAEHAKGLSIE